LVFRYDENPLWTAWRYARPDQKTYEFSFWVRAQWRALGESLGLEPGGDARTWPDVVMWWYGVQGGHDLLLDFIVRGLASGKSP